MDACGQSGRPAEDQLRFTPPACLHDTSRRPFRTHRDDGKQIRQLEPGIFEAVSALESGVARATGPHQSRTDRRHPDSILGELGAKAFGKSNESRLAWT